MAQEDEFGRIMKFFQMNQEERAHHYKDIFQDSAEFFSRFNYVMKNGTVDEKRQMLEELQELQRTVKEEDSKLTETTGMSEDELKAFAENKDNFDEDHWNMIQNARDSIQNDAQEIGEMLQFDFNKESGASPSKDKAGKPKKDKSDWLKS